MLSWCVCAAQDANKTLIGQSPTLLRVLIEGLLLDPAHRRYGMADEVKAGAKNAPSLFFFFS